MNKLDLSFTSAAMDNIHRLLDKFRTRFGKEAIPALMWVDSDLNVETMVDSQPAIGFYDNRADIKAEDIFIVDGLEIALTVADKDLARFVGKTLDYETDRFVLRERSSPASEDT
jgi:hypothetical protein